MPLEELYQRGDVWLADLEPSGRRELGRARLVLLVSASMYNNGPANMVVVLPITTRAQSIPSHVPIRPPEGGANKLSFIQCELVQCISRDRLIKKLGALEPPTLAQVNDRLTIILALFEPN